MSPGCAHCYAETVAERFWGKQYAKIPYETRTGAMGTVVQGERERVFTDVQTHEDRLLAPLRWQKPARVFVNSMSDLFHETVPDDFIDKVFAVMALAPRHTFQCLTKRPERMRAYMAARNLTMRVGDALAGMVTFGGMAVVRAMNCAADVNHERKRPGFIHPWPLPNVWLGVSVENRLWRCRIDDLRNTPAAIRFVSFEPLIEDVSPGLDLSGIQWAIWGGESGSCARPCAVKWIARGLVVCREQDVAPFVKQLGQRPYVGEDLAGFERYREAVTQPGYEAVLVDRKGGAPAEWPADLRVREWPRSRYRWRDGLGAPGIQ